MKNNGDLRLVTNKHRKFFQDPQQAIWAWTSGSHYNPLHNLKITHLAPRVKVVTMYTQHKCVRTVIGGRIIVLHIGV